MVKFKKLKDLSELIRPELPIAAGICVMIGEFVALRAIPSLLELGLGLLYGFLLSAPAMILNDVFDLAVDQINAPERPIPSGRVSKKEAIYLTTIISLLGLSVSFYISFLAVILYLFYWTIGFLYNWKVKENGIIGNLFVSFSVGSTIYFGSVVINNPLNTLVIIFSFMVFFFSIAEEIAADAMDIAGDKKRDTDSIAIRLGKTKALYVSFSLFLVEIGISFLPVIFNIFGLYYFIIISLTNLMIIYFAFRLLNSQTPAQGRQYIRRLYWSAIIGLIAVMLVINFL